MMVNSTGSYKQEQSNTRSLQSTDPWNDGFDQSNPHNVSSSRDNTKLPSEDRDIIQKVQRAKDRTFLSMMVVLIIFCLLYTSPSPRDS